MKYIALLRGINVGGNHKVEMKGLKAQFEAAGFLNVSTYINTGNVIFESEDDQTTVTEKIRTLLSSHYDFEIPLLVKTESEIQRIALAIPTDWQNNDTHKTDVAYLFSEIDSEKTLDELPIKREFLDIRYTPGAIFWNIDRDNYNKSHLNKLVSHKLYKFMTLRNVNTARYLAELK